MKRRLGRIVLFLILLVILWEIFYAFGQEKTGNGFIHIPEIKMLSNVWILERTEEAITIFDAGGISTYPVDPHLTMTGTVKEYSIGDMILSDQVVTQIHIKEDVIHGKVLQFDKEGVQIEGYGMLPYAENCVGYRLYDSPMLWDISHLTVGYDFADFVLENGGICAILYVREEPISNIRVLLKTTDYAELTHKRLAICSDQGMTIRYYEGELLKELHLPPGESITVDSNSPYLKDGNSSCWLTPETLTGRICVTNLLREGGAPWYLGTLEIIAQGQELLLINELSLEEYLYYVIPSEMPATYPEEALRAQAICARTYAYGKIRAAGYPSYGAHLDDSVQYQVYHNQEAQARTTEAVRKTYGIVLETPDGEPAETYYYSTSCGRGTDERVWGSDEKQNTYLIGKKISRSGMEEWSAGKEAQEDDSALFLNAVYDDDYESDQPWYRWTYQVMNFDPEAFKERMIKNLDEMERSEAQSTGEIKALTITERGNGGVAACLEIETDAGIFHVRGEYRIREVLCDGRADCVRMDRLAIACKRLLPSGFFLLETGISEENVVGYTIIGGGYGHGVGMSQNGAKKMAEEGKTAEEILGFFYEGCDAVSIYD